MPQFIYRITPTRLEMLASGPTDDEAAIIGEHFAYLSRKAEEGTLYMAGRTLTTGENSFGIAIFSAPGEQQARDFLLDDPAVQKGVMRGEVFPFSVALWAGNPVE